VQAVSAFQAQLKAVVESGNGRLLSNPHTTVLSSRTATFQVGGQVPVPVSITQTATGTTTGIEFKDFGVLVDVIPNATEDGVVTMRLRTEVSQPDYTIGFTPFPGASEIPGFSRRSTVTEVTVQPNGTIALGGLIQNSVTQLTTSIPLLSRLPILGSLFKSKRFQRNETELVIFVTPRVLPNTLTNGQTAPAGVVSAGNTTNVATKLGNPGIASFDSGRSVGTGGGAAP
jgi:pilus assembly protein CpaC